MKRTKNLALPSGSLTSNDDKVSSLEKLQVLRDFVGDSFSEKHLTDVLQKYYYNVEHASEFLLTGRVQVHRDVNQNRPWRHTTYDAVKLKKKDTAPRRKVTPSSSVKTKSNYLTLGKHTHSHRSMSTTGGSAPEIITIIDDDEEGEKYDVLLTRNLLKSISIPATATMPFPSTDSFWVLCERWISDAFCTMKNGHITYREKLEVRPVGEACVRLQSSKFEGRLPDGMARFLAPFLQESPPCIQVSASALMEMNSMVIGSQVPMSIQVWVYPRRFFGQFHNNHSSSNVLDDNYNKHDNSSAFDKIRMAHMYQLLQWAEYGETLPFEAVVVDEDDSDKNKEPLEKNNVETPDIEEDEEEVDVDDDNESATSTDPMVSEWASKLPEAKEPVFEGGVTLRPYQRSALHWMLEREGGTSRKELEEQLKIISELSGTQSARAIPNNRTGNTCDCGPVLVSNLARDSCRTIDGTINPIGHPMWKQRHLATLNLKHTLCFFVNEVMRTVSLLPPHPPTPCSGGILADSMGLGKTVMLLALVLRSKELREEEQHVSKRFIDKTTSAVPLPETTLVVVKLSLLPQWEDEIQSKTSLTYVVYYGPLAKNYDIDNVDVVLTTYGTLQADFSRQRPILLQHTFLRVILDEAQCIKNHTTVASKACCALRATYRWCVTGTVMQNSLNDVYGIMRFLKHEPWCSQSFWKSAISNPSDSDGNANLQVSLDRVRRLLKPLMLRRTKNSLTRDGKPILTLPPVETKVITVDLSNREREFYNAILSRSVEVFDGFVAAGTVHKSYLQILSMLQRLRQVCDHISLTIRMWNVDHQDVVFEDTSCNSTTQVETDRLFPEKVVSRCSETKTRNRRCMLDNAEEKPSKRSKENNPLQYANSNADAVQMGLSNASVESTAALQDPNAKLTEKFLAHGRSNEIRSLTLMDSSEHAVMPNHVKDGLTTQIDISQAHRNLGESLAMEQSSKMDAMFREMDSIWITDPGSKILIFSHYLGFLNLLEGRLSRSGVKHFRFDGSLSLSARMNVLEEFRSYSTSRGNSSDSSCTSSSELMDAPSIASTSPILRGSVLLISMAAGGEGLNLTAASTCFLSEPWWNSAKEDQCVNRIHRIGQLAKQVRVRKFVVNDSVEERIIELQQKKSYMANEIYTSGGNKDGQNYDHGSRLGLEDLRLLFNQRTALKD